MTGTAGVIRRLIEEQQRKPLTEAATLSLSQLYQSALHEFLSHVGQEIARQCAVRTREVIRKPGTVAVNTASSGGPYVEVHVELHGFADNGDRAGYIRFTIEQPDVMSYPRTRVTLWDSTAPHDGGILVSRSFTIESQDPPSKVANEVLSEIMDEVDRRFP